MADPLAFPILAGSALTQAFGFIYGRLAALHDRRHVPKAGPGHQAQPTAQAASAAVLPDEPDETALRRHGTEVDLLTLLLKTYSSHPDRIVAGDEQLREALGRGRTVLEDVFGRYITFSGEDRPQSGIRVNQQVGVVAGSVTGFEGSSRDADAHVVQDVTTVEAGGTLTGARIQDSGGRS